VFDPCKDLVNTLNASVEFGSSEGARFSKSARGVESQCDSLCSSPKTATACAINGNDAGDGQLGSGQSLYALFKIR
jgi:hypothetical protein